MRYVGHAAQLAVLAGATLLIVKSSEFKSRFRQTSAVSMTLLCTECLSNRFIIILYVNLVCMYV
jgi:hypothetical protein